MTSGRGTDAGDSRPQALQRFHTGWGKVTTLTKLLKVSGLGIENMNWTASVNRTIRALGALDPEWPKTWRLRGDQAESWGFQAE